MGLAAKSVGLGCLVFFFSLRLSAGEPQKVGCPDQVQVVDAQLAKPIEGWNTTLDTTPHRLTSVTFFDGTPEEQASLVPDRESHTRTSKTAVWLLKGKPERAYWLGCYYSGTSLILSRALPSGLTECTITYSSSEKIEGRAAIKTISCN